MKQTIENEFYTEKSVSAKSTGLNVSEEELEKIKSYCKKDIGADEVYVFTAVLCDNEVDRDNEAFTVKALKEMEELFVGKTVIFDHNPSAENQCGRIFHTELKTDSLKKTELGENYTSLEAKVYIPRTEDSEKIIAKIETGILKEMSVSGSVKRKFCSVCGKESCLHRKGKIYDGEKCVKRLDGCGDAYEISFVAVPAQRNAGVKKSFSFEENEPVEERDEYFELRLNKTELERLKTLTKAGVSFRNELTKDIKKNSLMIIKNMDSTLMDDICEMLDTERLIKLRDILKCCCNDSFSELNIQTAPKGKHFIKDGKSDNFSFRI